MRRKDDEIKEKKGKLQRKPIFESNAEPEDDNGIQRKGTNPTPASAPPSIENNLAASKGRGSPLPEDINQSMSKALGKDLSDVRVHTDSSASQMSQQLNAQAFTHENDVYFNTGKYSTSDTAGKHLLAHELTHTVQQTGKQDNPPSIQKNGDSNNQAPVSKIAGPPYKKDGYEFDGRPEVKVLTVPFVSLPGFKKRNESKFVDLAFMGGRIETDQVNRWNTAVTGDVENSVAKFLVGKGTDTNSDKYFLKAINKNSEFVAFGKAERLKKDFRIPDWDRKGDSRKHSVDHVVELQLGGKEDATNYELLDSIANSTIGSILQKEIYRRIRTALKFFKDNFVPDVPGSSVFTSKNPSGIVYFTKIENWDLKPSKGDPEQYWSIDEIKKGTALDQLRQMNVDEVHKLDGSDKKLHLFVKPNEGIPHEIVLPAKKQVGWLPGIDLIAVNLTNPGAADDAVMGNVQLAIQKELAAKLNAPDSISVNFTKIAGLINAGALVFEGVAANLKTAFNFPGLSPVTITNFDIDDRGLTIDGYITASIPVIENTQIDFSIHGTEFQLSKTFSSGEIKGLPPPLKITDISLTILANSKYGFGLEGDIDFELGEVGKGKLVAMAASEKGFGIKGDFIFNSKKFKGSNVWFKYIEKEWSAGGVIMLAEIAGIEKGSLSMKYDGKAIEAEGDVTLKVPGVKSVTLKAKFDNAGGMAVHGKVELGNLPGIQSGSVDATFVKEAGATDYSLLGCGEATPNLPKIPKLSPKFKVSYKNGLFKAEGKSNFEAKDGVISGEVIVGVTNATVGTDGKLPEKAEGG